MADRGGGVRKWSLISYPDDSGCVNGLHGGFRLTVLEAVRRSASLVSPFRLSD